MKRCPTCNRTFTEEHLSFCIEDGTPLVVQQTEEDEELTEVNTNYGYNPAQPPYQPPSYVSTGSDATKRRTWPWVVGILSLLLVVLIGFTVAAVILVPKLIRQSQQESTVSNNSNSSTESNPPSLNNSNVAENTLTPPPTDKEVVLAQLRDLEHEWTVANINADKKKLAEILADDYSSQVNGKMQGKAEYIRTIQRDTTIQRWEFKDLKLTLRGDRATLMGQVSFQLRDREELYNFVDRFVWRDGRWQATGSEVTLVNSDQQQ
jgi:hypothetical protein